MPRFKIRLFPVVALLLGLAVGTASAADTDPDGALYQPSENPLADVEKAIAVAGLTKRRALVVLGANWCHDSRALAARLNRLPLQKVIQENYELVMVDVGFYENGWRGVIVVNTKLVHDIPAVLVEADVDEYQLVILLDHLRQRRFVQPRRQCT